MPHSAANALPLSSMRLLTETTSAPGIFLSAFMWMTPIAPVPARQIFIGGRSYTAVTCQSRGLLVEQSCGVRDSHRTHLIGRESGIEQPLCKHREPFGHRRIDRLAKIGRDDRARHAGPPDVGERRLPRRLGRVGRRETMFDDRAEIGELLLLVAGQALRREFGVR